MFRFILRRFGLMLLTAFETLSARSLDSGAEPACSAAAFWASLEMM